jgi:hypothetical protein
MESIAIFKQSGYDFGAAESFGLFKCFLSAIHSKWPGLTALTEHLNSASGHVGTDKNILSDIPVMLFQKVIKGHSH